MKEHVQKRLPEGPAPDGRRMTQSRALARRIRERIQEERLLDGAFFMTEAQLAAEYGASRTVTREAVGRLQAIGILEGRKRKGLIVRRPDPLRLLRASLPSLLTEREDRIDLVNLRYALEVGAVELAVRNATPAQIEQLAVIEQELETEVLRDVSSLRVQEIDIRFHSLILEMTGSRLIIGLREVLVEFFAAMPRAEPSLAFAGRVCWHHRELLDAIRDRDVERARAMIRLQIRCYFDLIDAAADEASDEATDQDAPAGEGI
jgi:GntR family transcriptional repressor for pyruvate dehydrogenase complex